MRVLTVMCAGYLCTALQSVSRCTLEKSCETEPFIYSVPNFLMENRIILVKVRNNAENGIIVYCRLLEPT